MATKDDIRRIVADVFSERFGKEVSLVSVHSEEGVDSDGDGVLLVKVVYDSASGDLDAGKASGFVRHLLPKLGEASESRFPLVSFIEKSEAEVISPEAA